MADKDRNQGEGNREAAKRYNEAQRAFVKEGKVDAQAKKARQEVEQDPAAYAAAEKAGKARAAEDDPQVHRDYKKPED
jgi:hypothetical protein